VTGKNRYAYVFYATCDRYAVGVLVFVHLLKRVGLRNDIDLVLLHLPVSCYLLVRLREMGVSTRRVATELLHIRGGYYRDCLIKLKALGLTEYERVVFVDADAMPLRSLDFLFSLPFDEPIAAPSAYWVRQPYWTTCLFVAKPSVELWKRVACHFGAAPEKDFYDMDIVNEEFRNEIRTLPADVVCLNSEWEDAERAGALGEFDVTFANMAVVHFSALGKPWSYSPKQVRRLRASAHSAFHRLWDTWWNARDEAFQGSPLATQVQYMLHKVLEMWKENNAHKQTTKQRTPSHRV
jgi:hypothetical protein